MIECRYCGKEWPDFENVVMTISNDGYCCEDADACDRREAAKDAAEVAELRAEARRGEELSEAERQRIGGTNG
jgi:signal transduction histidine kinase